MSLKALILAGGQGTRLRPFTTVIPKPLMPVGDYPILEILLRQLVAAGVDEVFVAVGYLHHLLEAYFGDGRQYGLKIHYSHEKEKLGTAGPISLVIDRLGDDFLVLNGDLLTTLNYHALFAHHRNRGAAATIATFPREVKIDFGVVEVAEDSSLSRYIEKPVYKFDVSMGINALNAKKIRPFLDGGYLDIPTLMTRLHEKGELVACYREKCQWLDIGRHDDYQTAIETFATNPETFLPKS